MGSAGPGAWAGVLCSCPAQAGRRMTRGRLRGSSTAIAATLELRFGAACLVEELDVDGPLPEAGAETPAAPLAFAGVVGAVGVLGGTGSRRLWSTSAAKSQASNKSCILLLAGTSN